MIPAFLYHYTSVETLKLILQNEKIRFKRLDLLNDPLEGNLQNFKNFRKFVFSSSWTAKKIDAIPMWKMYSDLKGIRIRMPIDLFCEKEELRLKKIKNSYILLSNLNDEYELDAEFHDIVFADSSPRKNRGLIINKVYGPSKINYLDVVEDLEKETIKSKEQLSDTKNLNFTLNEINFNLLGLQKSSFWKFEDEYRFRVYPFSMIAGSDFVLNSIPERTPKNNFIDIKFNRSALNNIEILFGPKCDEIEIESIKEALKIKEISDYNLIKSSIQII